MSDMDNLEIWKKLSKPPKDALKPIIAGRLKGKSDINPQWRYEAMTEEFGMCGIGWKFTKDKEWVEDGSEGQKVMNVDISLYLKNGDNWSEPIPGSGGSMLIVKEKAGLYTNDEAVKMAVTDALGTAMKMIGVAAEIYRGYWDGRSFKKESSDEGRKKYKNFEFLKKMKVYKEELGEEEYYKILGTHGYQHANEIPPANTEGALKVFARKLEILKTEGGR